MQAKKAFLMVFHQDEYCLIIYGTDAAAAVREHYEEVDDMCPPCDPDLNDEFVVSTYEIGEPSAEVIVALEQRIEASDYAGCDGLHSHLQPDRREVAVKVTYTFAEGAIAIAA